MPKSSSGNAGRADFCSLDDFKRRVALTKEELRTLAELGALNCFAEHRRAAMWNVEEPLHDDLLGSARDSRAPFGDSPDGFVTKAGRRVRGESPQTARESRALPSDSPLAPMTMPERVQADYEGMNLTTGPHPMKLLREQLPEVWRASDLVAGAPWSDGARLRGT